MTDVITFEFYSDTNQANAVDELDSMGLDYLINGVGFVQVGKSDYDAMADSIEAIVKENGGVLLG